ncbi:MAG: hypothetical protein PUC18_13300 [Prevotellaceae bacterium]|nr:hypothetical protein [Prevotellaceae bacterium]
MTARITFRSEIYIEGKNLEDVISKFEDMPLFSANALEEGHAEYLELVSIEDADTDTDIMQQYNQLFYR